MKTIEMRFQLLESNGHLFRIFLLATLCFGLLLPAAYAQALPSTSDAVPTTKPSLPTLFIVGDSTAAYHTDTEHEGAAGVQGWGVFLQAFFNPDQLNVVNAARGGRSSRTFITEGLWAAVLRQVHPGDIVLIQIGQNDVFAVNDNTRARGTLPGIGSESQEIDNQVTHKHETVHTYGWYLRQYVQEVKASKAIPVVMSLTARNVWKDGHVEVGVSGYRQWAREIAQQEHVAFVDVSAIMAQEYEHLGQAKVAGLYHTTELVHTTLPGAYLAAECVVAGLKANPDLGLKSYLSPLGKLVAPVSPSIP